MSMRRISTFRYRRLTDGIGVDHLSTYGGCSTMVYRTDNIGGGEFPLRTARFTAEHNERRRQRQCVDQSLQSHRVFIRRAAV